MDMNTSHIPDGPPIRETDDLTRYWDMIESKYGIDRDELDPEEEVRICPVYHPLAAELEGLLGALDAHAVGALDLTDEDLREMEKDRERMEKILDEECFVFPETDDDESEGE